MAEAACTRMNFAKREAEVTKEKASLDLEKVTLVADLEALKLERKAAVAPAET